MLRRADLGSAAGWSGGAVRPDLASTLPCTNYQPKQSDLVLTGAAESKFKNSAGGVVLDSEAQVLRSAQMVALDWQRTVANAAVLPCLRSALAKQSTSKEKFVSMEQVSFPAIGTYTRAFRALTDVTTAGGSLRIMVDIVLVGRGRTELSLTTTARYAARSTIVPAEQRVARLLASRAKA